MAGGANVGSAFISIIPEIRNAAEQTRNALGPAEREMQQSGVRGGAAMGSGMMGSLGKAAAGLAALFAVDKIVGFFKESAAAASDLGESTNKVGVIFGAQSKVIFDFGSTTAKSMGISNLAARDAAASFGVFGKSAGLSGTDLSGFATKFTGLAADMASFSNTTPEQAIQAIGAAFRGEAEPIRNYGVLLDDATLRQTAVKLGLIATTDEALTPQNKVLAAAQTIWEQTGAAQGDFARTSDGVANQSRITSASLEDQKAKLGESLLPVWSAALSLFQDAVIPALGFLGDALSTVSGWLAAVPGPVWAAVGGFAAMLVVGQVVGFMQGLLYVVPLIIGGMGGLAGAAALASRALAAVGGPWVVGLGLAVAAIAFLATRQGEAAIAVSDLSSAVDEQTGKLKINALALITPNVTEAAQKYVALGGAVGDYSAALAQSPEAQARVNTSLNEFAIQAAQADIAAGKYGAGLDATRENAMGIINTAAQSGVAMTDLGGQLAVVGKLWDTYNNTAGSVTEKQEAVKTVMAETAANLLKTGDAAEKTWPSIAEMTKAIDDAASAAQKAAQGDILAGVLAQTDATAAGATRALDLLKATMDDMDGRSRSLDETVAQSNQTFADMATAWTAASAAGDLNTDALANWDVGALTANESGQKVFAGLNDIADQYTANNAAAYSNALATGGVTAAQDAAKASADQTRARFVDMAAQQLGGNVPAAEAIADRLGILAGISIPDKTFQTLNQDDEAWRKFNALNQQQFLDKAFLVTARAEPSSFNFITSWQPPDKTQTVFEKRFPPLTPGDSGGATGDWGSYSVDDQPYLLHRGEHILDAGDVAALGGQTGVYDFRRGLHQARASAPAGAGWSGGSTSSGGQTMVLRIEGDGLLAEIIRQTSTTVVERNGDRVAAAARSVR